jgi:hypothetical protein
MVPSLASDGQINEFECNFDLQKNKQWFKDTMMIYIDTFRGTSGSDNYQIDTAVNTMS